MPTNGEIIRTSYTAFARGDVDGALTAFAPDIERTHPGGLEGHGLAKPRKGHDEVREFMTRARIAFSTLRPDPQDFVESGDRVVVFDLDAFREWERGAGHRDTTAPLRPFQCTPPLSPFGVRQVEAAY